MAPARCARCCLWLPAWLAAGATLAEALEHGTPLEACADRVEADRLEGLHCYGLTADVGDARHCEAACCQDVACQAWQYHPAEGCFRGIPAACRANGDTFSREAVGARLRPMANADTPWISTYGDPRTYNAFEAIEPYVDGPESQQFTTDSGEAMLVRRFGPAEDQLEVALSCWAPGRAPANCCRSPEAARRCWPHLRDAPKRCCQEGSKPSDSDPDLFVAYDVFVDLSSSWSPQERHFWHTSLPNVVVDAAAQQETRLRYRLGVHPPHFLCASKTREGLDTAQTLGVLIGMIGAFAGASSASRLSRTFLNIGSGDCAAPDPLHKILGSEAGRGFRGVAVDIDQEALLRCGDNLARLNNSLHVATHRTVIDPWTIAGELESDMHELFHGQGLGRVPDGRWPLDLLVVDVDGCDCPVAEALLGLVAPKVVTLEIAFHVPPPFRFSLQCGPGSAQRFLQEYDVGHFNAASGCSLSAATALLARFGLRLFRLSQQDAVFVHDAVAQIFERHVSTGQPPVRFPLDEIECYRQSRLWLQFPVEYVRDWFFAADPSHVVGSLRSNLTMVARLYGREDMPFTLDF